MKKYLCETHARCVIFEIYTNISLIDFFDIQPIRNLFTQRICEYENCTTDSNFSINVEFKK